MKKFTCTAVATALIALVALFTLAPTAFAGRLKGPGKDAAVCPARGTVTYYETFRGGENAEVAIVGNGSTDLDIYVYDNQGRLVTRAIGLTDIEVVRFFVPVTATYRVVIVNLGNVSNRYGLGTN